MERHKADFPKSKCALMSDARTLSIISTHISIPEACETRKQGSTAPTLQCYTARRRGIICIPAFKSPVLLRQPNVRVTLVFLVYMHTYYPINICTPPYSFYTVCHHLVLPLHDGMFRVEFQLAVYTLLTPLAQLLIGIP